MGILWYLFFGRRRRGRWLLTMALGCVTAGILGNLYDRLGLPGLAGTSTAPLHQAGEPVHAVRDWILVMIGQLALAHVQHRRQPVGLRRRAGLARVLWTKPRRAGGPPQRPGGEALMSSPTRRDCSAPGTGPPAAREAGDITLEYFRREDLEVERKDDDSPVTVADRRAEEHLRDRIAEAFAADAILGEELPDRPGSSGFRWILDPIDGTKSFIHGVPLYGTLVGIEHEGEPVAGRDPHPRPGRMRLCGRRAGGLVRPRPESRRGRPGSPHRAPLAQGLFLTSEVATFDEIGRRDVYDRLQAAARLSRSWGDCYGYLMVATGRAELMVDPVAAVWDLAPLLPILEEAGGTFTDWQGRRTIHSGQGHRHQRPDPGRSAGRDEGKCKLQVISDTAGYSCPGRVLR